MLTQISTWSLSWFNRRETTSMIFFKLREVFKFYSFLSLRSWQFSYFILIFIWGILIKIPRLFETIYLQIYLSIKIFLIIHYLIYKYTPSTYTIYKNTTFSYKCFKHALSLRTESGVNIWINLNNHTFKHFTDLINIKKFLNKKISNGIFH